MKNQITDFLNKVQEMRQAQKAYFRFRGDAENKKGILIRSKSLETDVDIEAERLQSALASVDNLTISERARVIGELNLLSPRLDRLSISFIDQLIDELKNNSKFLSTNIRVEFEHNGQDYLSWEIDSLTGHVVKSLPNTQWTAYKVKSNGNLRKGGKLSVMPISNPSSFWVELENPVHRVDGQLEEVNHDH